MRLRSLKVGDHVFVYDPNWGPRKLAVTRVGRRWLHTAAGRFDVDTGTEARGGSRAVTVEEHEEIVAKDRADRRLRDIGVVVRGVETSVLRVAELLEPLLRERGV